MLCMAIFFFLKGTYGALSPKDYSRAMEAFGLPTRDVDGTALDAAFFLVSGLLYGIAWVGSYLERPWDQVVCLAALAVFLAGQVIVQFVVLRENDGAARAVALFIFWVSLPVFQYCTYRMGLAEPRDQPESEGAQS
jgi:hypothetical protein